MYLVNIKIIDSRHEMPERMLIIVLELALINTLIEKELVKVLKRIQNIRLLQFETLLHKDLQLDILLIM